MASYQDLEQRLIGVEERLKFLFGFMRLMKDGPLGPVQTTLENIFLEAKQHELKELATRAARNFRAKQETRPVDESGAAVGSSNSTVDPNNHADVLQPGCRTEPPLDSRVESFQELRTRLRSEGVI